MEANNPANRPIPVPLVMAFLQGCLLAPLLHLFSHSRQSLLPSPGSALSLCAPSPLSLALVGRRAISNSQHPHLVFFPHSLQAFSLQPVQTHCPLALSSTQGIGFSYIQQRTFCKYWGGNASPRSYQVLSFPLASKSVRLKCIHLPAMLRPSRVPLYSVSIFIK